MNSIWMNYEKGRRHFVCAVCNDIIVFCDDCGLPLCECTDYCSILEDGLFYCEPDCPKEKTEQ